MNNHPVSGVKVEHCAFAEFLPQLPQVGGHDRHSVHRVGRIFVHLRPGCHCGPHKQGTALSMLLRLSLRCIVLACSTVKFISTICDNLSKGTVCPLGTPLMQLTGISLTALQPTKREDAKDVVFATEEYKWKAVVQEIRHMHKSGRPVLVGTTSVERSEGLAAQLDTADIKYQVHARSPPGYSMAKCTSHSQQQWQ